MNVTKKVINMAKETIATELELTGLVLKQERGASEETRRARRLMTDEHLENFADIISRVFATLESGGNIK